MNDTAASREPPAPLPVRGPEQGPARVSVVIPARNEHAGIRALLPRLRELHPEFEIIVVDDGSEDGTGEAAAALGARVIRHPESRGNGAAVKSGVRAAHGELIVLMDADLQHPPEAIGRLLERLGGAGGGYDMVVAARDPHSQASLWRGLANRLYNGLASWMVGRSVADLTSGFRVVRADRFREFLYLLPNGFSYPATITMAFFRAGYGVAYETIEMPPRQSGESHIRPLSDGARFLLIIFRIATLYSPLKLFAPASLAFFGLGAGYYAWTFATAHRFTNMSALLLVTAVLVFLIGLVSEQITTLVYQGSRPIEGVSGQVTGGALPDPEAERSRR